MQRVMDGHGMIFDARTATQLKPKPRLAGFIMTDGQKLKLPL
jgi:hypothetical protein